MYRNGRYLCRLWINRNSALSFSIDYIHMYIRSTCTYNHTYTRKWVLCERSENRVSPNACCRMEADVCQPESIQFRFSRNAIVVGIRTDASGYRRFIYSSISCCSFIDRSLVLRSICRVRSADGVPSSTGWNRQRRLI